MFLSSVNVGQKKILSKLRFSKSRFIFGSSSPLSSLSQDFYKVQEEIPKDESRLKALLKEGVPFTRRHIGPTASEITNMLETLNISVLLSIYFDLFALVESICRMSKDIEIECNIEQLIERVIPADIRSTKLPNLPDPLSERQLLSLAGKISKQNKVWRSYIGMGYYNCIIPNPILRNVFENPAWLTPYTPYQCEIAQGRLESLFNFQTMVCELTGLDCANASLLDEGTAAAEAMGLMYRHNKRKNLIIHDKCHPSTLAVVKTRAIGLGINVLQSHIDYIPSLLSEEVCGVILQYPDTEGSVFDFSQVVDRANQLNCLVAVGTDLLALSLLKSPGEFGASIAFGSCQRFGTPLGFGGPHAAFFGTKSSLLRLMPGRIVGLTRDSEGEPCYRLALQTREQHIRRTNATSNICTSQALLANMSAMFAIYHGADGIKHIAERVHTLALLLSKGFEAAGHVVEHEEFFDTLKVNVRSGTDAIRSRASEAEINLRYFNDSSVGISLDETSTKEDIEDILSVFSCPETLDELSLRIEDESSPAFNRSTPFLTQQIFNCNRSETELIRYIKRLESKDLSLVHSMIPLGSCTMKLNATVELMPCSFKGFTEIHPFVPISQAKGYLNLITQLEDDLCKLSGYDKVSFQPNSGAQGELAGLFTIRAYFQAMGQEKRNICLIPKSAHGTNFASASMLNMKVVELATDDCGFIYMDSLLSALNDYREEISCAMITYPSTHGLFDPMIRDMCARIHQSGALVYIDGANLNAQLGLCRPGDYGGDVSHFNLHKTFCIPHGGGGPGMGPIAVKKHLIPFLPSHPMSSPETGLSASTETSFGCVSSSPVGSALILPITWAYIRMMGAAGLEKASQIAILNANYMCQRLSQHFKILHHSTVNPHNEMQRRMCGHEFIVDLRGLKVTSGVEVTDVAKRLMDFGFHSPTVSWPVAGCLMIEPTECENKKELDTFCDVLIQIRKEIQDIEEGITSRSENVLKCAPKKRRGMWPSVGRADEIYGDRNPITKRPPFS